MSPRGSNAGSQFEPSGIEKLVELIKASIDGVISNVQVRQGDQVRNRQILIEIEPEHADAEAVTG